MSRYYAVRAPAAIWVGDDVFVDSMRPALNVPDHEATDTGLLDANGNQIMRAPRAMGFGRRSEW